MQKLRQIASLNLIRLKFAAVFQMTTVGLRGLFPYAECSCAP
jgi:hypothetical protein